MTLEELEDRLESLFPGGFEIEFDDSGRLVVMTNLCESDDEELVDIDTDSDSQSNVGSDMDDEDMTESYDESSAED